MSKNLMLQCNRSGIITLLITFLCSVLFSPILLALVKQDLPSDISATCEKEDKEDEDAGVQESDVDNIIQKIRQELSQAMARGIEINLTVVGENANVTTMNNTTIIGLQQLFDIIVIYAPLEISKPRKTVLTINLPIFKKDLFIESKDKDGVSYLVKLRKQLKDNKTVVDTQAFKNSPARSYTVSGIGGIGKTQLAIAYAYEYEENYDFICWIDAENEKSIIEAYRKLLKEIFEEEICRNDGILIDNKSLVRVKDAIEKGINSRSDEDIVGLFIKKIPEKFDNWLIVYDNVESAEHMGGLTPKKNGNIIITSRNRNWSQVLELDLFQSNEAVDYLFNATKKEKAVSEEKYAKQVTERLGCLPLALAQAAAYIRKHRISFQAYLGEFEEKQYEIFEYNLPKDIHYGQIVMTVWNITMDKITKRFPQASVVMNRCAYLNPDNILLSFFSDGEFSEKEINEAIEELDDYSMLAIKKDKLSIHRLVQTVIRLNLENNFHDKAIDTVQRLMELIGFMIFKSLQITRTNGVVKNQQLISHFDSIYKHGQRLEIDNKDLFRWLLKFIEDVDEWTTIGTIAGDTSTLVLLPNDYKTPFGAVRTCRTIDKNLHPSRKRADKEIHYPIMTKEGCYKAVLLCIIQDDDVTLISFKELPRKTPGRKMLDYCNMKTGAMVAVISTGIYYIVRRLLVRSDTTDDPNDMDLSHGNANLSDSDSDSDSGASLKKKVAPPPNYFIKNNGNINSEDNLLITGNRGIKNTGYMKAKKKLHLEGNNILNTKKGYITGKGVFIKETRTKEKKVQNKANIKTREKGSTIQFLNGSHLIVDEGANLKISHNPSSGNTIFSNISTKCLCFCKYITNDQLSGEGNAEKCDEVGVKMNDRECKDFCKNGYDKKGFIYLGYNCVSIDS